MIWRCLIVLLTFVLVGCGKGGQERNLELQERDSALNHDALLGEYQKIADRATDLVEAKSSTDASAAAEMLALEEKVVALMHKKLRLFSQETLQQAQQYDSVSAKFQAAVHAFCRTCPGRR
jgi:hypothetical protein